MENIKPIKIFIECLLPITACNIKCHYCYVAQFIERKYDETTEDTISSNLSHDRAEEIINSLVENY